MLFTLSQFFSYVNLTRSNNYSVSSNSPYTPHDMNVAKETLTNADGNDTYYLKSEDRRWILSTNSVNINMCATKYDTRIQIDKVPINVLKNGEFFYVCEQCGKIYWAGTYLERQLNDVIKDFIVKHTSSGSH